MDLTRRSTLGGLTAAGLALPVLVACGEGESGAGADPTPSATEEATSAAPSATTSDAAPTGLVSADDVPVGGGVVLHDEKLVITQPTAGEFKGFSAVCTHQGCIVSGVSTTIDCACHQSAFSLTDGSVQGGPAPSPLEPRTLEVSGDQISLG